MDPLSQGGLGASLAAGGTRPGRLRIAAALGLLSGMAADLDVLIGSATDPLLFLEYHRQFSHALVFVPIGALLCAGLAHAAVRRWLRFRDTYLFCLLGYASHGLLDACTSYGTQLLWPFADVRVAWNHVSVVDPLFTLPLLGLLGVAAIRRRPGLARLALAWGLLYLGLGAVQHERARAAGAALAAARGHDARALLAKPSFGNLLVWKTVYSAEGHYLVDAVRLGLAVSYHPGERTPVLAAGQVPWLAADSRQARDLARFRRFSMGYLAVDPEHPERIVDVRYSMIPNRIDALWGIELDPQRPDAPVRFVTDRDGGRAERERLLELLLRPGLSLREAAAAPVQAARGTTQKS